MARIIPVCAALSAALFLVLTRWGLAFPAPAAGPQPARCPDPSAGETAQDCPWAEVARQLVDLADSGKSTEIGATFSRRLPELDAQLRADAKRTAWKKLWGTSINFDELAGGVIVHPAILKALAGKLRIPKGPMEITHVHAGMEHTYGYLFSVLRTQFGFKRARWVDGEIARGFELPEDTLGPRPPAGTLFANVTYLTGRIAFRDEHSRVLFLKESSEGLPSRLREFDFGSLKPVRLEERVEAKDVTGDIREVILRTDLVPFKAPQKNTHLLVYSVHDPSQGGSRLISAFPVMQAFVDTLLKADDLGEDKPVRSRYNAFVEGVTGQEQTGSRRVIR